MDELRAAADAIEARAQELGLALFLGSLLVKRDGQIPIAAWAGEWSGFLEVAARAGSTVLYVEASIFNLEELLSDALGDADYEDSPVTDADGNRTDDYWRIHERLCASVERWRQYDGWTLDVRCHWFAGGVVHEWFRRADWYDECDAVIDAALEEVSELEAAEREEQQKEKVARFGEQVDLLARHERFHEATSETRRVALAKALFPEEKIGRLHGIAAAANTFYWEAVEPALQAEKANRARELYAGGIRNARRIATLLHMPESKVYDAIANLLTPSGDRQAGLFTTLHDSDQNSGV